MYCSEDGLPYPNGNCTEGYYCPPGEILAENPDNECQPGHYCPTGSKEHNVCPRGEYQPYKQKGECLDCPPGKYCDPLEAAAINASGVNSTTHGVVTPFTCPRGYFCPNRTATYKDFPCRKGYFGNVTKLTSHDECQPCTPGRYCETATMTNHGPKCEVGYYCKGGAITGTPNNESEGGGPCPQGFYCESGYSQPLPCPEGTYGDRMKLGGVGECTDCPGGMYCGTEGLTQPNGTCHPGFFCTLRAVLPNPEDEAYGKECPKGHYCPEKTTTAFACPPGTFNNKTKGTRPEDCVPCEGGKYCEGYGNEEADDDCSEGYYCKGEHTLQNQMHSLTA